MSGTPQGGEAEHVLAIASTMRGAALAYAGPGQVCRASTLDLWAGGYPALLLAKDEAEEIFRERSDLGALMRYCLRAEFGADPRVCCFENSILPWVDWLLRDTERRAYDVTTVVTCEEDLCTRPSRLGGEMAAWFPRARHVPAGSARVLAQHGAFWACASPRAVVITLEQDAASMALWERSGGRVVAGETVVVDAALGAAEAAFRGHLALAPRDAGLLMEWARGGEGERAARLCRRLVLGEDGSVGFLGQTALADALGEFVPARQWGRAVGAGHRAVAQAAREVLARGLGHVFAVAAKRFGAREIVVTGQVAAYADVVAEAARMAGVRVTAPAHPGDEGRVWGALVWASASDEGLLPPAGTAVCGPGYADGELREAAAGAGLAVESVDDAGLRLSELLAAGEAVGVLRGRTPFGGARSGNFTLLRARRGVELPGAFDPQADGPLPDWLEELPVLPRGRTVETPGDAVNALLERREIDAVVLANTIVRRSESAP